MDSEDKYFYELLNAKLDNELNADQETQLSEYLKNHPEYEAVYEEFKRVKYYTSQFYLSMEKNIPDISLWESVSKRIKQDESSSKVITFVKHHKWISWGSSAVAASIMIFFSFYLFLFSPKTYNIKNNKCIINSIESNKSSVMVIKDKETNTTIIWMFSAYKDANSMERTTS